MHRRVISSAASMPTARRGVGVPAEAPREVHVLAERRLRRPALSASISSAPLKVPESTTATRHEDDVVEVVGDHSVDGEQRVDAEAAVADRRGAGGRLLRVGLAAVVIDARQIVQELGVELAQLLDTLR